MIAECAQENTAPNTFGAASGTAHKPLLSQGKRMQRKTQRSKKVTGAAEEVVDEEVEEERSMDSPRAAKQRKVGDGALALFHRVFACDTVAHDPAGGSGQGAPGTSPPLGKVQERYKAFAERAQASSLRGSSSLAVTGRTTREFDGLARSVEGCAI